VRGNVEECREQESNEEAHADILRRVRLGVQNCVSATTPPPVIPAKAGIHLLLAHESNGLRLSRNDELRGQ
jgi:hypothetical protein